MDQERYAFPVCILHLGLLALLFFGNPVGSLAQVNHDSAKGAQLRFLNNALLRIHGRMQQAASNQTDGLRTQAATVIAQRAAALSSLIADNPREALAFAFSPELLADLAAKFPQSSPPLEAHIRVAGTARHWIADYPNKGSRSWWQMNAGGRTLNLYFAGPEPASLKSDEVLQATGVLAGSNMAVETSVPVQSASSVTANSSSIASVRKSARGPQWPTVVFLIGGSVFGLPGLGRKIRLARAHTFSFLKHFAVDGLVFTLIVCTSIPMHAQSSCSTTGVQKTIVILVNLPNGTAPSTITPVAMNNMFFGTAPSLNDYWQETSYGLASAAGDVYGPFILTGIYSNTACQSLTAVQSDAMAAAAASGANFQNYNRVVVIFPDVLGCGWSGLSSIGCSSLSTPSGVIEASSSYVSAAYATPSVITHELGHALGLSHATSRAFTDSSGNPITLGPLGTSGNLTEYGDKFSTMSCCSGDVGGEYAAPHKTEVLDWLPPNTGYQTVQASGSYTIEPYEVSGGLKAIKVQRGTGNDAWLWLEYRQSDGNYDTPRSSGGAFPSPVNTFLAPQPYSGALIHYEDATTDLHSHLINYTPSDSSFFSPALGVGRSWSDPYSNVSLSVVSATSAGLTVNVSYGSTPCTQANPTVSITPRDPSTYPGNGTGYSMSVTNNDSSGCSASTFTPSSTQPSGFASAFSDGSITLNPGLSGSLTMTQTPPAGTPPGTYAVSASASNSSYVGSATSNLTVMAAPSATITVSVPASSYTPKSTVPITATVTNAGSPVSGASITFTLTTASGNKLNQSTSTRSKGTATWSYKLNPNAPTGTYSISAQATVNSTPVTSNPVTFAVQ